MIAKVLIGGGLSCVLSVTLPGVSLAKTYDIKSAAGVRMELNDRAGNYSIASTRLDWKCGGELVSPATNVVKDSGSDNIGTYHQLKFLWQRNRNLRGSIRVYDNHQ